MTGWWTTHPCSAAQLIEAHDHRARSIDLANRIGPYRAQAQERRPMRGALSLRLIHAGRRPQGGDEHMADPLVAVC